MPSSHLSSLLRNLRLARRRKSLPFAIGVSLALWTTPASAYPTMVRHGYTGCATCHADPSGAGLLTPYGRAQSDLLLSTAYRRSGAELEPRGFADALFGLVSLPDQVLVGGWIRGGYIWNASGGRLVDRRALLMRTDLAAQVRVDRFRASGSVGVATNDARPLAQQAFITSSPDGANLVSREHWLGVDLADDAILLRAGRINVPFGLRNIEHTAWVRSETRTDFNQDQQHGVAVAFNSGSVRAEGMAILGNYQVRPDAYRERGLAGYVELAITEHHTVGVSALAARAALDPATRLESVRQAYGVFSRLTLWRPLVLLAEGDILVTTTSGTDAGAVGFLQADAEVWSGVHIALTGEALREARSGAEPGAGVWATASWFILPHFDVRFDLVQRWGLGAAAATTYLVQLHGYL